MLKKKDGCGIVSLEPLAGFCEEGNEPLDAVIC
jgi:hypothetical protein